MLNQNINRKFEGSEHEGKGEVWMKTFRTTKQNQRIFIQKTR